MQKQRKYETTMTGKDVRASTNSAIVPLLKSEEQSEHRYHLARLYPGDAALTSTKRLWLPP